MNLGEALSLLKKEKIRLARLIELRKNNVYREAEKPTAFDPQQLSEEINKKVAEIRKLKMRIQKTNLLTIIDSERICLAEAIIKLKDIRNTINELSNLFEKKRSYFSEKEEKEKVAQLDELQIEDEIAAFEKEKVELDNKIQMTNWATPLQP